jgi:hypothetical protein
VGPHKGDVLGNIGNVGEGLPDAGLNEIVVTFGNHIGLHKRFGKASATGIAFMPSLKCLIAFNASQSNLNVFENPPDLPDVVDDYSDLGKIPASLRAEKAAFDIYANAGRWPFRDPVQLLHANVPRRGACRHALADDAL